MPLCIEALHRDTLRLVLGQRAVWRLCKIGFHKPRRLLEHILRSYTPTHTEVAIATAWLLLDPGVRCCAEHVTMWDRDPLALWCCLMGGCTPTKPVPIQPSPTLRLLRLRLLRHCQQCAQAHTRSCGGWGWETGLQLTGQEHVKP